MFRYAIKMLFGDSAKFYGILLGLGFASLLIAQQASIFVGLMSRTFAFIGEVGHVDLWVFDPTQSYVDEPKPLRATVPLLVVAVLVRGRASPRTRASGPGARDTVVPPPVE